MAEERKKRKRRNRGKGTDRKKNSEEGAEYGSRGLY